MYYVLFCFRIVREYGLLNKSKAVCLPNRYPYIRNIPKYDQLFRYGAKLLCAFDLDYMLEGLHHEMKLRQTILYLQDYRNAGLTRLAAINVLHKLKVARERHLRELSTMTEGVQGNIHILSAKMGERVRLVGTRIQDCKICFPFTNVHI